MREGIMITTCLLIIILFLMVFGKYLYWAVLISMTVVLIFALKTAISTHKLQKNLRTAEKNYEAFKKARNKNHPAYTGELDEIYPIITAKVDKSSMIDPQEITVSSNGDAVPTGIEAHFNNFQKSLSERLKTDKEKQLRLAAYTELFPELPRESISRQTEGAESTDSSIRQYQSIQSRLHAVLAAYHGSHLLFSEAFKDSIEYMRASIPYILSEGDYQHRDDVERFETLERSADMLLELYDVMWEK